MAPVGGDPPPLAAALWARRRGGRGVPALEVLTAAGVEHAVPYETLFAAAARAAAGLRALCGAAGAPGAQPVVVACVDEGAAWPLLWLAALLAGAVLAPVDVKNEPPQRLARILRDLAAAGPCCAVVHDTPDAARVAAAAAAAVPVVALDGSLADPPPAAVLIQNAVAALAASAGAPDVDSAELAAAVCPGTVSHVIFTSGTTGVPKGVVGTADGLQAYCDAAGAYLYGGAAPRVLLCSPSTFDPALGDMVSTWLAGGTLVVIHPRHLLHAELGACVAAAGATHCLSTPAVFRSLFRTGGGSKLAAPALRCVALGGEAIPVCWAREFAAWADAQAPPVRLVNAYGATEATVYQTMHDVKEDPQCIGRPVSPDTALLVLLPTGPASGRARKVVGEAWVCGRQVALGYLPHPHPSGAGPARVAAARPDEHFATLSPEAAAAVWGGCGAPAAASEWWRRNCFRTGDVVEVVAAGDAAAPAASSVFLVERCGEGAARGLRVVRALAPEEHLRIVGRKDASLVKIRGRRMELAEVEAALRRRLHAPGLLSDVAVAVHDPDGGDAARDRRVLAAFCTVPPGVCGRGGRGFAVYRDVLKAACAADLPAHMTPSLVVAFADGPSQLPVTRNGKVDRRLLLTHPATKALLDAGSGGVLRTCGDEEQGFADAYLTGGAASAAEDDEGADGTDSEGHDDGEIAAAAAWIVLVAEAWCEVVAARGEAVGEALRGCLSVVATDGLPAAAAGVARLNLDFHTTSGGDSLLAVRVCRWVAGRVAPEGAPAGAFGELLPEALLPRALLAHPRLVDYALHLHRHYADAAPKLPSDGAAAKAASAPAAAAAAPSPPAIDPRFTLLRRACDRGAGGAAVARHLVAELVADASGHAAVAAAFAACPRERHPFYAACAAGNVGAACWVWAAARLADGAGDGALCAAPGLGMERHFETLLRVVGEGATPLAVVRALLGDDAVLESERHVADLGWEGRAAVARRGKGDRLVDRGAAMGLMKKRDAHGQTLLHRCARGGGATKVFEYLMEVAAATAGGKGGAGVLPGQTLDGMRDGYGRTPLQWAVINGHEALARRMTDRDVQCDATGVRDAQGETALEMAERRAVCAAADLRVQGKNQSVWGSIAKALGGSGGTKNLKKTGKM